MATPCTHYPTILKPGTTDNYNIGTFNDNYDEIDAIMYANQQAAAKVFVGATANDDGESGRVPVPTTTDKDKYLKGDGTWDTPSGGGGGAGADEMTLDEYNALTTSQKNDGTIRFIPQNSSSGTSTAVDMSGVNVYKQYDMTVTATSSTQTDVAWDGSSAIGCNWNYTTPIDVTNISAITFTVTNGSCWGNGAQADRPAWDMMVGLMTTPPSDVINVLPSDASWAVVADMPLSNHVYEETLDVSGLSGNYYIVVFAHGWNTTVEDITLHTGGAYPSQIKYMSKTYALVSVEDMDFSQLTAQQIADLQAALGIN